MRAICGGGRYDNLFSNFSNANNDKDVEVTNNVEKDASSAAALTTKTSSNSVEAYNSIPAVGFGFGDAVIVELLKMKNLLPDFSKKPVHAVMVYSMDPVGALHAEAIRVTNALRDHGISTEVVMQNKKLKSVLQRADRCNAGMVCCRPADETHVVPLFLSRTFFDFSVYILLN